MVHPGAMAEMIDDNYANYVVQTALEWAEGEQRAHLIAEIMPLLGSIKSRSWYKRIITKMAMNGNGPNHPFDSRLPVSSRPYGDEGFHRMNSEPRGLPLLPGFNHRSGTERSAEPLPPNLPHPSSVVMHPSERNGFRMQQQLPHSQVPQQYGNFYPYGPVVTNHPSEYRTNGDY
jgi:Pumilio-family RNA binding repeat